MSYDRHCYDLARDFLLDSKLKASEHAEALAQEIQNTIECYIEYHEAETRKKAAAPVGGVMADKTPQEAERVIEGPWGYACVEDGAVFIPAVQATPEWPLRRVLAHLHEQTGMEKMIFSAILDADDLRPRLRAIVREYDHYVPEMDDFSHCIEIRYEPKPEGGE